MLPNLNYRARKADVDALVEYPRPTIHLDTYWGSDGWLGTDWDHPVQTMARALALVSTGGRVLFKGKVAEEITGSNLKFDVTIEGVGSLHHADQPGSGTDLYDYGSSVWQSPTSPAAPLIQVRGRGWTFKHILFDAPTAYAAIKLVRNASSGTDEYDASHATIEDCEFRNGLYGIQDSGGQFNVRVRGCTFETLDATTSGAGIVFTDPNIAPRKWQITNCFFQADCNVEGSERHIVSPLNGSLIKGNVFGTVKNTGKYIDLTGGSGNIVFGNLLMGKYDTSDYVAGTGDSWAGNQTVCFDFTDTTNVSAAGVSLTVPTTAS